jgi:hypothetical protein
MLLLVARFIIESININPQTQRQALIEVMLVPYLKI